MTCERWIVALGLGLWALSGPSKAQAGEPCCNVTSINENGVVTAREAATGKVFQFKVNDQAVIRSLRVGQKIYADFGTRQVSVDEGTPCCSIVSVGGVPIGTAKPPVVNPPAHPGRFSYAPSVEGASPCCSIVANPDLKGRLGRIVFAFPAAAVPVFTGVAVFKDGKQMASGHGSHSVEMLGGTYEVTISGKRVPNVPVKAGHDTNVNAGVLRISAGAFTAWEIIESGTTLKSGHGSQLIGLPPGSYDVKVGGGVERITIKEGQVTEF